MFLVMSSQMGPNGYFMLILVFWLVNAHAVLCFYFIGDKNIVYIKLVSLFEQLFLILNLGFIILWYNKV